MLAFTLLVTSVPVKLILLGLIPEDLIIPFARIMAQQLAEAIDARHNRILQTMLTDYECVAEDTFRTQITGLERLRSSVTSLKRFNNVLLQQDTKRFFKTSRTSCSGATKSFRT